MPRAIEYVPLDEIKGADANPKRHADSEIRAAINRFGYTEPIILDERTGKLVAGHGRVDALKALREAGKTPPDGIGDDWSVPVLRGWESANDDEANAYLVASNRLTELGGWDDRELVALLDSLDDLTGVGYTLEQLQELSNQVTQLPPTPMTDPDHVPEPPKEPVTKRGDVWILQNHRVVCGDSTDPTVLDKLMQGEKADLVWTDPPYGVAVIGGAGAGGRDVKPSKRLAAGGKAINNDKLDPAQLRDFLIEAFDCALLNCKPGAAWYVAAPGNPPMAAFASVLAEMGIYRQTLVWVKNSLVMGQGDYHYRHEPIFYGWTPGAARLHPLTDRTQDSVWEIDRPTSNKEHPTMKPVALIERALENSSSIGGIVLDPFGGSGSTLMACQSLGRNARLVELDPTYTDVILRRWAENTGGDPVRDDGARWSELVSGQSEASGS